MYWTPAQMLAHMTANGASTRTGDFYASGTVSGPDRYHRGCLLELSWGGAEPLTLPDGSVRSYLEDGDEVTITATARRRRRPHRLRRGHRPVLQWRSPLARAALPHPLAQFLAVQLAHAGQRHGGHDRDLPRVLVRGQMLLRVLGELGHGDFCPGPY